MIAAGRLPASALAAIRFACSTSWAPRNFSARREHARRLIHENGVTHNVYGDPDGLDRPWSLDLIPLLIPVRAVAGMCREGLIQRARLLDALLADLYGPARTVLGGPAAAGAGLGQSAVFCALPWLTLAATIAGCISTPPIWCAPPTGNSESSAIARRRRPARDIRSKIASFFRARCRRFPRNAMCSGWRRSSSRCAIR